MQFSSPTVSLSSQAILSPTTCRMLMTYCHYSFLLLPSFSPTIKPKPKVSDTSHFFSLANNSLTEPYFASQSISSLSLSPLVRNSGNCGQDIEGKKREEKPFHPALKANSISPCSPMSENSEDHKRWLMLNAYASPFPISYSQEKLPNPVLYVWGIFTPPQTLVPSTLEPCLHVLVRDLQRNRINRIDLNISGDLLWKLAHMIMEAESHDL